MNSRTLSAVGAIVLVLAVGAFVYVQNNGTDAPTQNEGASTTTNTGENTGGAASEVPTQPSSITKAEVAAHGSRTDCWTIINGTVYDLTSWIPNHPGGEAAIVQLCGTDGSAKFNNQHGGSSRQEAVLAGFKIGALAQ